MISSALMRQISHGPSLHTRALHHLGIDMVLLLLETDYTCSVDSGSRVRSWLRLALAFEIAAYSSAHIYEADSNCRHYFADEISCYPTFNIQMAKIRLLAGKPLSDLLFFNLQTLKWTNITNKVVGTLPAPRYGHGFAAANDSLFVFAGCGLDGGALFNFST